ncbi:hypothetical protein BJ878DRAFT_488402 [Calycina marina]|uniref:Uncharacterized protein n=1 Tax=Calycina marina TaxID=1763456 RepID=A0A9P7ZAR8_9HELO|nr:hypothetical protein BJ878DRAFT_488402 [Calycina marina]
MQVSRTAARVAARSARAPAQRNVRFASTNQQAAAAGGSSGLVGGIAGGALVFAAGYGYYHFSGAKTMVNTASATKNQIQNLTSNIQSQAPAPNEALKWLRSIASSYSIFIPGANKYIDSAFDELDKVHEKHSDEVEKIIQDAYTQLKDATKSGMTMETAIKNWEIIESALSKLGKLAADSSTDFLDNNPEIKEKFGGNLHRLKSLADSGGESAKKELQETYDEIKDIIAGGVGFGTIARIKKLIEDKTEKVKELGDEAWKKGMEQVKPYLDKNPEIKNTIEENADKLKSGSLSEILAAVKDGNTDKLNGLVLKANEQAKSSGMAQSLDEYAKMIPGGSEIFPKLQKLGDVAKDHGEDAKEILNKTYKEVADILSKRATEIENIGEKTAKESKK